MVKVGMDTDSPGNHAGYDANPIFNATGFSQLHDDGTGGAVPLSLFKLWPMTSCGKGNTFEECQTSIDGRKTLRKVLHNGSPDDAAEPGYFSSNLSTNIRVELTSTRRTALHRYTFPRATKTPRIVVDITNDGQRSSTDPEMELDPDTARVMGGAHFEASFGPGRYHAFTCVDFKGDGYDLGAPKEFGAWLGNFPVKQTVTITQLYTRTTSILARVGVSFISAEQACANAEQEIPDFNFDEVRSASRAQWSELLGRIQVDPSGVDPEIVDLFYSSMYRTHISPADCCSDTDENPRWNSTEPYYDSFYCNWDTYRTLYSFMALHDPATFARIILTVYQAGCPSVEVLQRNTIYKAEAVRRSTAPRFHEHAAALGVPVDALYQALLADAESQPPNWDLQGRQANVWKSQGYIPSDVWEKSGTNSKQVSRTLEYAFDDFTISQVAKVQYAQRSENFLNVWNPNVTFPGEKDIKGFMQGGKEKFVRRLNFIFDQDYFDSTDEPSQQIPFMYHYANEPGQSTQRSRQVIAEFYNTSVNGLPGNDDSGAMGSYVAFYLAGLYPLPATRQFLLSSPYFREISFTNPVLNTTTTIHANGFRGNPKNGTGGHVFVKSVTVDGKQWKSNCFIDWDAFTNGARIELELTDNVNVSCGRTPDALPPSLSTGGYD
ncbi:Glycoside Hydrolase Family 92 protein [Trametes cinnabarina]|uniref:Glycoside Hydrolase Family 92 protein n=1 Tax=Pycnoporus cinnabarinus TaxID=5643 RepID=A0A060SYU5_PYCCI|nr:Glycoside Hydrolase Family 92 protein [Trametes cinnabarina]